MMPTFPRSPLSFRTAGFPQYDWKAGFPSGAFLDRQQLKPAPGIRRPSSRLHPPFVHTRSQSDDPALCRAADSIAHRLGRLLLLHPSAIRRRHSEGRIAPKSNVGSCDRRVRLELLKNLYAHPRT